MSTHIIPCRPIPSCQILATPLSERQIHWPMGNSRRQTLSSMLFESAWYCCYLVGMLLSTALKFAVDHAAGCCTWSMGAQSLGYLLLLKLLSVLGRALKYFNSKKLKKKRKMFYFVKVAILQCRNILLQVKVWNSKCSSVKAQKHWQQNVLKGPTTSNFLFLSFFFWPFFHISWTPITAKKKWTFIMTRPYPVEDNCSEYCAECG